MKVTVCFDDAKVVVPCGDGSNTIQYLINEAFLRYRRIAPMGKDLNGIDPNHLKLSLKDGGILDLDDKISDVIEDKEQVLAIFQSTGVLSREHYDKIEEHLDFNEKVQGHSSPISDKNYVANCFEDSLNESVYCVITAEDLECDSHLRVIQNGTAPDCTHSTVLPLTNENLNEISMNITKERSSEQLRNLNMTKEDLFGNYVQESEVEVICFKNNSPLLGIHVMPEYNEEHLSTGLRVRSIEKGGLADKDGRLRCDDIIIGINDCSLFKVDFQQAQEIFMDARSEPELHLKVIHKGRKPLPKANNKLDHPNIELKPKETDEVFVEELLQGGQTDASLKRKEYASMTNLSHTKNDLEDVTHVTKSVSMNDLTADDPFCQNKTYSSLSNDENNSNDFVDNHSKSMKLREMFADGVRFHRNNAYDSLNRAVDKSIEFDPEAKDQKKGHFRSNKSTPAKKQHWWSRLKLSKKSQDNLKKKTEVKNQASRPDNVEQPLQPKGKSGPAASKSSNSNKSNNSNKNNNNNSISIDSNKINTDCKTGGNKNSFEWISRLDSHVNSPTSQSISPIPKTFNLSPLDPKINNVARPSEGNGNLPGLPKARSRSAVHGGRKVAKGINAEMNNILMELKPIQQQVQARSFVDLRLGEIQNNNSGGSDGREWNKGNRRISHYDTNASPNTQVPYAICDIPSPVVRSEPNGNLMRSGRPSPLVLHPNLGHPHGHSAYEKLFGRSSEVEHHEARRVSNILKDTSHRRVNSSEHTSRFSTQVPSPGPVNNPRNSQSQYAANVSPQNHHFHYYNPSKDGYLARNDTKMVMVVDGAGSFSRHKSTASASCLSDHLHSKANPWSPIICDSLENDKRQPSPWNYHYQCSPQISNRVQTHVRDSQSKAFRSVPPLADDLLLHKISYNHPSVVADNKHLQRGYQQPNGFHEGFALKSPQLPIFHHVQQNSDLTDYSSNFHQTAQVWGQEFYNMKR